jgi:hypothetical protein
MDNKWETLVFGYRRCTPLHDANGHRLAGLRGDRLLISGTVSTPGMYQLREFDVTDNAVWRRTREGSDLDPIILPRYPLSAILSTTVQVVDPDLPPPNNKTDKWAALVVHYLWVGLFTPLGRCIDDIPFFCGMPWQSSPAFPCYSYPQVSFGTPNACGIKNYTACSTAPPKRIDRGSWSSAAQQ